MGASSFVTDVWRAESEKNRKEVVQRPPSKRECFIGPVVASFFDCRSTVVCRGFANVGTALAPAIAAHVVSPLGMGQSATITLLYC
mmetsp:Transcript_14039/g.29102  ORF Transcript_14039/g.29102 Transcript_14039/m.29102 type:complete len:86 (+) Transcript_14039:4168-4425(+)